MAFRDTFGAQGWEWLSVLLAATEPPTDEEISGALLQVEMRLPGQDEKTAKWGKAVAFRVVRWLFGPVKP
jgi:hypothetical protein